VEETHGAVLSLILPTAVSDFDTVVLSLSAPVFGVILFSAVGAAATAANGDDERFGMVVAFACVSALPTSPRSNAHAAGVNPFEDEDEDESVDL